MDYAAHRNSFSDQMQATQAKYPTLSESLANAPTPAPPQETCGSLVSESVAAMSELVARLSMIADRIGGSSPQVQGAGIVKEAGLSNGLLDGQRVLRQRIAWAFDELNRIERSL